MYKLFLNKEFTSPWIKLEKDTLEKYNYNYIVIYGKDNMLTMLNFLKLKLNRD